jgi:hypothetical protein
MGINPSKSAHFIFFPLTSSLIFAEIIYRKNGLYYFDPIQ